MTLRFLDSHLSTNYLEKYSIHAGDEIFIETGTYRGDTLFLVKDIHYFKNIYSCEIFEPLYNDAVKLFENDTQIQIKLMESPEFLEWVFKNDDRKATIWLDAHASGPLGGGKSVGSPVLDELRTIKKFGRNDHTILIDDRRLFGSGEWGGVSEHEALALLHDINPNYKIDYLDGVIEKDIICAYV